MGRVLRARKPQLGQGNEKEPTSSSLEKIYTRKGLTDKTNDSNYMALRSNKSGKRQQKSVNKNNFIVSDSKQEHLLKGEKHCIYDNNDTEKKEDISLLLEEKIGVYTFEVDKNDPQPKKARRKRRVKRRKISDISDTTDDDSIVISSEKKQLRSTARQTRVVKSALRDLKEKRSLSNKHEKMETTDSLQDNICGIERAGKSQSEFDLNRKVTADNSTHPLTENETNMHIKERRKSIETIQCEPDSSDDIVTENRTVVNVINFQNKNTDMTNYELNSSGNNKENIPLINRNYKDKVSNRKSEVCGNLSENSEVNFSFVKPQAEHKLYSNKKFQNRKLLLCSSEHRAPQTIKEANSKEYGRMQSREDFNIDNYFGFDEESEDDLYASLSPVKKPTDTKNCSELVPLAVTSTPNNRPIFTKTATQSAILRVREQETNTVTSLLNLPETIISPVSITQPVYIPFHMPTKQCASVAVPLASTVIPTQSTSAELHALESSTLEEVSMSRTSEIPDGSSVLFADGKVQPHFSKPPRKSYERPTRIHHHSYMEEENESENEVCDKKRTKRSKKPKKKDKSVENWAANVSAHFDDIESFDLCVE
ncbi:uncharacterized protein [Periplaneta americana]|uniref:uncharacterized protein n=1 Tax=Periplaneta americana TaxID=6978 RepID=UPI0037E716C9